MTASAPNQSVRSRSAGWSVIASDATGSIIAVANPFADKGMALERREDGYSTIDEVSMAEGIGVVAVSAEGHAIAVGNRSEHVRVWTKFDKGPFASSDLGYIDPSCVTISGPQHRIAAIAFDPNDNGRVFVATQEGCLAIFKRTDKGWNSQLVDMQIPDVTSASISPDSRWAAFGTGKRSNTDPGRRSSDPAGQQRRGASALGLVVCLAFG